MFRGIDCSKTTYYRRIRKASELKCSINDLPDMRGKHNNHSKGSRHPRWNNGVNIHNGYLRLNVGINHPLSDPNGYAYLHIVVWVSCGNPIPNNGEIIHHVNGDKLDNRIQNLKLMTSSEHCAIHNKQRHGKIVKMPMLDGKVWDERPE